MYLLKDNKIESMTQKEIKLAAEKALPYEPHPDKFTQDMRNKAIDFGRLCFVKGAEFILNSPQIVCRKFK